MASAHAHLGLSQWPFSVVPRPELCDFIAGREVLRRDVEQLLRTLSRRDTSSINVLWSWFGAGKTHALHYIHHEAKAINKSEPPIPITPIYTEFPKSAKSFVDLYRCLAPQLNLNELSEDYLEVSTSPTEAAKQILTDISMRCPDLESTFRSILMAEYTEQVTAKRWLQGEQLSSRELGLIGASQPIKTTDQAILVMSAIVRIMVEAAKSRGRQAARVLWLIDEFQRVAEATRKIIADVNAGLHSLFNACPTGLTPVFSFSGQPNEQYLPDWFSPELRDRIGTTRVMVLPPFQSTEALLFVKELLQHFRPAEFVSPSDYFPFEKSACEAILARIDKMTTTILPRTLMHAFDAVLSRADQKIEAGEIDTITPDFANSALTDYILVSDQQEE